MTVASPTRPAPRPPAARETLRTVLPNGLDTALVHVPGAKGFSAGPSPPVIAA